ncbi:Cyclophilin-type peptidyl-prolyl cis-trans isomerase domain [Dillenia turbinata]|uniref:Cyclophilin-type peptidyl-prolyl cis-trans isomerase domain n=1 Tax=Dillenia turbinata TaxID=194707 RepID=A0AAN8W5P6_9MAGN
MASSTATSTFTHSFHSPHRRLHISAQLPARHLSVTRRSLLFLSLSSSSAADPLSSLSPPPPPPPPPLPPSPDTTITDRVFLDFSLCPNYFRSDRSLDETQTLTVCEPSEPLGRVVIGLYGKLVPLTCANFKSMCTGSSASYRNTFVQRIFPGQFFLAGKQGRRERGEVEKLPLDLVGNTETVDSRAFLLEHSRAGVVSLCLGENDDDDQIKLDPDYRNVEFLITTGPGPCPQLDGRNIVFGTVLEGLDVVTKIASIPTYKPAERIRQFNDFAEFLGDERAQIARASWNKPLKTVYISDCGELKVAKPSLSPRYMYLNMVPYVVSEKSWYPKSTDNQI